jgi:diguanylate cyclase (GGDEF)-like protein
MRTGAPPIKPLQLLVVTAAWLSYGLLFAPLFEAIGQQVSVLIFLPILATALMWGLWATSMTSVLAVGLNAYLLMRPERLSDVSLSIESPIIIYSMTALISGLVMGHLYDVKASLELKNRQLADANRRLQFHSTHDPLTGLYNRSALQQVLRNQATTERLLAFFLIDLDDFKQINDGFGQAVGDEILKQVASRLQGFAGKADVCGRITGDEFVLICEVARYGQAGAYAMRILDRLKDPFVYLEQTFFVRASIGISLFPRDGDTFDDLLRAADSAIYRVKRRGKGSYESYSKSSFNLNERFELEYKLRDALECNELELYYQPQVEVTTGRLVSLEALLRWHHPDMGLIAPAKFIDIAEHTGLIIPIGAWVLETVCRQQMIWQEAGYAPARVAVNVSTVQFSHPDFWHLVMQALHKTGLKAQALELEITEGALMKNMTGAVQTLHKLKDLGVQLAIDDFGVGYSSLSYLQKLPVHTLKIDKSFMPPVNDMKELRKGTMMIGAIIGLAHGLGKTVIAEGVDNELHLEYLRQLGCELAQGFYFGEPLPVQETKAVLMLNAQLNAEVPFAQLIRKVRAVAD